MLNEYPDILTTEEACEALRVGYNALYELLQSGKLKAYRNGRVWRIPKKSIMDKEFIIKENPDVEVLRIQPANTKNGIVLAIETV